MSLGLIHFLEVGEQLIVVRLVRGLRKADRLLVGDASVLHLLLYFFLAVVFLCLFDKGRLTSSEDLALRLLRFQLIILGRDWRGGSRRNI